jgi:hypothetical protein
MKLFIANCTKQTLEFYYRMPDQKPKERHDLLTVPSGGQVQFPGDHIRPVLDAIVSQNAGYGWIESSQISRKHPFVGVCYSFDKPVSNDIMCRLIEVNDTIKDDAAQEEMVRAASAMAQKFDELDRETSRDGAPRLQRLDVSIDDVPNRGEDREATADGVSLTREAPASRRRARG